MVVNLFLKLWKMQSLKYQYRTRTSFPQIKVFLIQSVPCKRFHCIQSFGNLVMTLLKVNRSDTAEYYCVVARLVQKQASIT